jgi:DNA repair protein RecN (Recombination protein N)
VLCITHLPQVAAAATAQFMVIKSVKDGRTETTLSPVEGEERIAEIARMLGGVTDSAKAHASTLMKGITEAAGTSLKSSKKARK